CQHGYGIPYSF
nr:immunoglobulin light chain junction region [Macaca mulatta]MOV61286.1 immunoglobulin light chain junction region [Macaca mulatta]MOV61382.1 immunoglobulin light chain junction region [Macaca mulatta]MOV61639.1 immunoglobulin light chain junction region [Macaca mulatta]MOV61852.1 immunoglobulin light chain junction region [Macaca mulatta]